MLLRFVPVLALSIFGMAASAQSTPAVPASRPNLSVAQQISVALTPAPAEFRDSATVLGYGADRRLRELRAGTGAMVCLAPDLSSDRIQAVCYHRSLEPFMARGRELRAQGLKSDQVDSVRIAEVRSGRLKFPDHPATLYSISGDASSYDAATGTIKGRPLYVIYVRDATAASTGLPAQPTPGMPWIMGAGTLKAHIMFVPSM